MKKKIIYVVLCLVCSIAQLISWSKYGPVTFVQVVVTLGEYAILCWIIDSALKVSKHE